MMLRGTEIKAVVFDAYGTLLDVGSLTAACAAVTADPSACVTLWRAKQLEYTFLRSPMGRYVDFWRVTADALDYTVAHLRLAVAPAARERLLEAWLALEPYPDAEATLRRLASRPLAVLSNGSPRMLETALEHAGLRPYRPHVFSVDPLGIYKPAPRVYEEAPRCLGVAPERILFVSGNSWDAAGAASFGLRVAWLNRAGVPFDVLGQQPDWEIRLLRELTDRLDGPRDARGGA